MIKENRLSCTKQAWIPDRHYVEREGHICAIPDGAGPTQEAVRGTTAAPQGR